MASALLPAPSATKPIAKPESVGAAPVRLDALVRRLYLPELALTLMMLTKGPHRVTATSCSMFLFSLGSSITVIGSWPICTKDCPSPFPCSLPAIILICASSKRFEHLLRNYDISIFWQYKIYYLITTIHSTLMAIQLEIAIVEKPVHARKPLDCLNSQITFLLCYRFQADYLLGLQHKSCGYRRKMFVVPQLEIARPDLIVAYIQHPHLQSMVTKRQFQMFG